MTGIVSYENTTKREVCYECDELAKIELQELMETDNALVA